MSRDRDRPRPTHTEIWYARLLGRREIDGEAAVCVDAVREDQPDQSQGHVGQHCRASEADVAGQVELFAAEGRAICRRTSEMR